MLEKLFRLDEHRTTVRIEIIAGATTYLTMAYIVFVNPLILSGAGMDRGAVFVATCLASAFATLLMALFANYPLALAPGMGMNAYFTYSVVKGLHYSWEVALGAVFISGVLFLILSVTRVRSWIVDAIPLSQKFLDVKDAANAKAAYEAYVKVYPDDLRPSPAGVGLVLKEIARREPKAAAMKPEQFVDTGALDALADEGFFKRLKATN